MSQSEPSLFEPDPLASLKDDSQRPLAERMRPETLEEFVGQQHILGPGQAAADADRARSARFHHPLGAAGRRQNHAGAESSPA